MPTRDLSMMLEIATKTGLMYTHIVQAMFMCTIAVHKRMNDGPKLVVHVRDHMTDWLERYSEEKDGTPYDDIDQFFCDAVIETRNFTEKLLGVRD